MKQLLFFLILLGTLSCSSVKHVKIKSQPEEMTIHVEYELELVSDTHCKIHSLITSKVYYVPLYAIQETLDFDKANKTKEISK